MKNRFVGLMTILFTLSIYTTVFASNAVFTNVKKVIAVGDLHGDYEQYIRVLKANKLVNAKLKWIGGDTHFVQLGDVTDRGPDSLKIINHLMKFEKQAKKAGGMVHVLIGNHEAMNIQTDLRYVHPGEYAALVTKKSKRNQANYINAVFHNMLSTRPELAETKAETRIALTKAYPLGYVEHRRLWEAGQKLAKWYAKHNAVIQINDTLYLHGGLDPHVETLLSLKEINEGIRNELSARQAPNLTVNPRGPLWYRGLARNSAEMELPAIIDMLEHYGVKRIVVAHSTTRGAVTPRFDRRVILADVGIGKAYGSAMANYVSESGKGFALHRGTLIELPLDGNLLEYLEMTAKLEPKGSRLARCIESSIGLIACNAPTTIEKKNSPVE
ncbi:MAG: hypothetical protein ACI9FB_001778 [Candidatus Azotimanducaceae bacterium]|jgi:hypothetical protein